MRPAGNKRPAENKRPTVSMHPAVNKYSAGNCSAMNNEAAGEPHPVNKAADSESRCSVPDSDYYYCNP